MDIVSTKSGDNFAILMALCKFPEVLCNFTLLYGRLLSFQAVQQEGVQVAESLQHFLEEFEAAQSSLRWIRDEFRAQARGGSNYGTGHEGLRLKRDGNTWRKGAGRFNLALSLIHYFDLPTLV